MSVSSSPTIGADTSRLAWNRVSPSRARKRRDEHRHAVEERAGRRLGEGADREDRPPPPRRHPSTLGHRLIQQDRILIYVRTNSATASANCSALRRCGSCPPPGKTTSSLPGRFHACVGMRDRDDHVALRPHQQRRQVRGEVLHLEERAALTRTARSRRAATRRTPRADRHGTATGPPGASSTNRSGVTPQPDAARAAQQPLHRRGGRAPHRSPPRRPGSDSMRSARLTSRPSPPADTRTRRSTRSG